MVDVIGFGALNFDRLFKVDKLAKGDSEVHVIDQAGTPGGSAANTIYGLGKLGASCGFVGALGKDYEGERLLDDFKKVGVDTSRIAVFEEERTGIVIGFVDKDGERALYVSPGANMGITDEMMDVDYFKSGKIVHMSSFVGDGQFDIQNDLVESLAGKVMVSLCPGALYVNRGLENIRSILESSDIVFLNKVELESLMGKDYQSGARDLLEMGCGQVAVTLGNQGSFVADADGVCMVPAEPKKAVDTTGAGDSYAAGFLYGVLLGKNKEECGRIGNIVASKCIESIGARTSLPTAEELQSSKDFPK